MAKYRTTGKRDMRKVDRVRINLYLEAELARQAKHKAIDKGYNFSMLVSEAIREYLDKN